MSVFDEIRPEWDALKESIMEMIDENHKLRDENTKLRACLGDGCADCAIGMGRYADRLCDPLKTENAKLREACAELLKMAERNDPEWIHWPEMHEELRKLGVKC